MSTPVDMETSDERALAAMLGHHEELRRELDDRVTALRTAVQSRATHEQPLVALREFVNGSVLPHATAEEATLYPAAASAAPLLVEAMTTEHRALADLARALAGTRSAVDALAAAVGFAAVFAIHVTKENELLLPLLTRTAGVSLAELLEAMHHDVDEPDDATPEVLDVRTLPHGGGRHEAIFAMLDALRPGGSLVIVNDHDPRPLRFQLDAAWPGVYSWDYLQTGPQVWRVAITRHG
jgi:uncharacterized protein (DUF2249 family)